MMWLKVQLWWAKVQERAALRRARRAGLRRIEAYRQLELTYVGQGDGESADKAAARVRMLCAELVAFDEANR